MNSVNGDWSVLTPCIVTQKRLLIARSAPSEFQLSLTSD